jgi:23S rRNA (cytidine1920-2'-O)/16S rRNA (cytidine1409-2'-O)-methyltransferase
MIMAGEVTVNGQVIFKPGSRVSIEDQLELKAKPRFVSRGGDKLAAALEEFAIDPSGWICADVGASTGGFTDCLLQHGAAKVYAIDVGYGQLFWSLRRDLRVVAMERINARYLEALPEPIDFASIDVSFISTQHIMPAVAKWLRDWGQLVILVKPQFEAGRRDVGKGGVVRDAVIHRLVLASAMEYANRAQFGVLGLIPSPLRGPSGNVEFLLWLKQGHDGPQDVQELINSAVNAAHNGSEL